MIVSGRVEVVLGPNVLMWGKIREHFWRLVGDQQALNAIVSTMGDNLLKEIWWIDSKGILYWLTIRSKDNTKTLTTRGIKPVEKPCEKHWSYYKALCTFAKEESYFMKRPIQRFSISHFARHGWFVLGARQAR